MDAYYFLTHAGITIRPHWVREVASGWRVQMGNVNLLTMRFSITIIPLRLGLSNFRPFLGCQLEMDDVGLIGGELSL